MVWLPGKFVQKQPVSQEQRALFIQFEESHAIPAAHRGRKKQREARINTCLSADCEPDASRIPYTSAKFTV